MEIERIPAVWLYSRSKKIANWTTAFALFANFSRSCLLAGGTMVKLIIALLLRPTDVSNDSFVCYQDLSEYVGL